MKSSMSSYRNSLETIQSFDTLSVNNESPSLSKTDEFSPTNTIGENIHECYGLRVSPSSLEFTAVFDGEKFNKKVLITNISQKSIEFYLEQPISMAFEIIDNGTKISLAPGLSVKKTVVFQYRPETLLSSFFYIRVKRATIEIPVFLKRMQTKFTVTPESLHFGTVDVGSPLVSKYVKMENLASVAAQYKIVIGPNENHIQVTPCKGLIRPNEAHTLRVQFYPTVAGQILHVIRQKNEVFCTITLEASIIQASIVVLHKNTTGEFTLCDFPLTFAETTRYDTVAVCNTSAHHATFVVMGEIMNSLFVLKSARKMNSNYKMFSVQPTEGRIAPLEKTILTITYKPVIETEDKGWQFVESNWLQKSHFCFFKIVMVEVKDHTDSNGIGYGNQFKDDCSNHDDSSGSSDEDTEWFAKDSYRSFDSTNLSSSQGFRLCLHGLFTAAVLEVSPGQLKFKDLQLGAEASLQVTVTNQSLLKLGYCAVLQSYVHVLPAMLFIEAGASVLVEVSVCAYAIGTFKRVVTFECLSMENVTDSTGLKVIGETKFIVEGDVKANNKKPQPKLNLGITPKITHEVGFLSEEVTYGSKNVQMPAKAIVAVGGRLPRMHNASEVVAFPNDMPRSLQALHPDKVFRSIFTGKERYVPPIDCCLTYTQREKLKVNKHNEFWLNYMRTVFEKRQKEKKEKGDRGLTVKDLKRLNAVVPLVHTHSYAKRVTQSLKRQASNALSPLELYNIKVNPRMLNFYTVAVNTECEELMYVANLNSFAVTIRVISTNPSIRVRGDNQLKINPFDQGKFSIVIHSSVLGFFNGMFKYIINEKHMFEMVVAAEIVEKFLDISTQEVRIVEQKNNPFYVWSEYITLKNRLKSDTAFTWTSKSYRCFDIVPKFGSVPGNGELNCAITYRPSLDMESSSKINLLIGDKIIDTVKSYSNPGRAQTTFINPVLNLGSIPLNLKVVAKSVLFNASFRKVPFNVAPCSEGLMKGVTVSPIEGFIQPRGDVVFTFTFTMLKIGPIDFQFAVESGQSLASLKVVGHVVFPKISITPDTFQSFRVPRYTHTTFMLTAENQSTAIATVSFLIDQHHHFKVSLCSEYGKSNTIDSFPLQPGATEKFFLHFFPTDLATHEFYLPVVINHIIGPPVIKVPKTLTPGYFINQYQEMDKTSSSDKIPCVWILCTVAPPPLNFSKVVVECVGDDEQDEIVVSNNRNVTAYVGLKQSQVGAAEAAKSSNNSQSNGFSLKFYKTAFFVDKKEKVYFYEIAPGGSIRFIVLFNPPEKGFYEEKLLVFHTLEKSDVMDFSKTHQPYTQLILQGKSSGSLIASDPIIYFPPIPLDVESLRKFTITKDNYSEDQGLNLNVNTLNESVEDTLTVSYSDETIITNKKLSLQITIVFKSSRPISFKTQLIFRDLFEGEVSVTVIATADNCLLTTHAFSSVKYRAQIEAGGDKASQIEAIQFNHVEFVKSTSDTALAEVESLFISKSTLALDRRAIKSQTSLLGSVSQRNYYPHPSRKSSLISHTKILKFEKVPWQSTPAFPDEPGEHEHEHDEHDEYVHMRNVRAAMERYLFGQIFNCTYYWTIGENIKWSSAYKPPEHGSALSNIGLIKSLVELLDRFCGRDIHTVLPHVNIPFPKDDEARVLKVVVLLEGVLEYLIKLGACLGHFAPEDLLDFHDYEIYRKIMPDEKGTAIDFRRSSIFEIICNPENLPKEKYEKKMIQCWLDLFLQVYKVCILYSIKHNTYKDDLKSNAYKEDANKNAFKLILKDKKDNKITHLNSREFLFKGLQTRVGTHDRSLSEHILLAWLEDYYTRQKNVVWEYDPPEIKSLDFFDSLSDSLVFAAVTSYFCPFISSMYFENMFTHPKGEDQLYHNAICLLKAWNNIRLGIIVHASELIDSNNCIQKLMIVVHLYKVLPSYVPEAVLDFSTPLTTCKELPIQLTNNSLSQANYYLIMIGDPYRRFVVQWPSNVVMIKSKKKVIVNIQYTSNKVEKESATILFCGSCVPPFFAPNQVFTLEGYAQKLKISKVINFETPLNKIVNRTISLSAPYGTHTQDYEFELCYSEKMPTVDKPFSYVPWSEVSKRKLPQRIEFPYSTISIPGKGRKTKEFAIKICCFTPKRHDYYFVLMNHSVGDFIIQISIKPKAYVAKEPIQLQFEENATEHKEQYSDFWAKYNQSTSPNAVIKIPFRNDDLWTSLMAMFELKFNASEKPFWTTYLETNIGLKLIQWMIGDKKDSMTDEIRHIFRSSVNYKVSCSSELLIVPPALRLPDIKMKGTIDFPVYVKKDDVNLLDKIKISLTADHGNEIRVYNVMYNGKEE